MHRRFCWLVPVVVACAVYYVGYSNFFVYDDFIWLYRAQTLTQNWRQIFSLDVLYFDPLVYLSFLADCHIAGLNPVWYHLVDLSLHALNACLVYHLAYAVSEDQKGSIYAGVFFAASFAVADAVFWPSSRVDLICVLFTLASLIQYLGFLRGERRAALVLSVGFFILALGAKGTPVVIPLFLVWFCYLHNASLRFYLSVFPFAFLGLLYVLLVRVASPVTHAPLPGNIKNLCLAACDLFIPERHLANLDPFVAASLVGAIVLLLAFCKHSSEGQSRMRTSGFVLLAAALLPVLVLRDFKLATRSRDAVNLLSSPSHRIYLASVGAALLGGGAVRWLEGALRSRLPGAAAVTAFVVAGFVCYNATEVRARYRIWQSVGNGTRAAVNGLISYRDRIKKDGVVGLVQFPGSNGFMTPMTRVFLGRNDITTYQLFNVASIPDKDLLENAERSSLFVLGAAGSNIRVYDFSDHFRNLLHLCNCADRNEAPPASGSGYEAYARELNQLIAFSLGK